MKRIDLLGMFFLPLLVVLLGFVAGTCFTGCDCTVSGGDAAVDGGLDVSGPLDVADAALGDVVEADENEGGHDAEAGVTEPTFCAGRPSVSGGAADHHSCACEHARGDRECANPASSCVAAPRQPTAFACHKPCASVDECGAGEACQSGFCWLTCPTTSADACPTMLLCSQYENPVAGTRHVCVPEIGYVSP
jgi:hypothetical protein